MAYVIVFAVGVVAVVVIVTVARARERRQREAEAQQLFPLFSTGAGPLIAPPVPRPPHARPHAPSHGPSPANRAPGAPTTDELTPAAATRVADAPVRKDADDDPPTMFFRRPVERPVQLLPGRLEVVAGEPRHKEIRLVRVPGEAPEVILGREPVDAPGRVALHSPTVSRRHARLAYTDGAWTVANLSRTNPLVVNDAALPLERERPLADGDRLELGEVVLRFRALSP